MTDTTDKQKLKSDIDVYVKRRELDRTPSMREHYSDELEDYFKEEGEGDGYYNDYTTEEIEKLAKDFQVWRHRRDVIDSINRL